MEPLATALERIEWGSHAHLRNSPIGKSRGATMDMRRMIAVATAIVAMTLLAGWWYVYPGDLPFAFPTPR